MNNLHKVVLASDCGIFISSYDDISTALGASIGRRLILSEAELGPAFFDLRTGLAGELIQKFVNYRIQTGIIIATPEAHGERFAELAREHATHPMVRFVRSMADAMKWMNE